ncbi:MAG: hypothetical protein GC204_17180 [Chloroflexi bacterium]|nr:hypothetical protein [Chloroflexota bacterium]
MPLTYLSGDPLLTKQPMLAFGSNAAGRTETTPLATALLTRYPTAFASYGKLCRQGRIQTGMTWYWYESKPALAFMVVRETPVGATRLRQVDAVIMALARDYRVNNIRSVALAPLGADHENEAICEVFERWLSKTALPVMAYVDYAPNRAAEVG